MKEVLFLTPIEVERPPRHTQVFPRCFTCSKFPTCNLRSDYLKTLYLIQNVLGDPQDDYCFTKSTPYRQYPCYEGIEIKNPETIFPAELTFTQRILPNGDMLDEPVIGTLISAKYQDLNTVLFLYDAEHYIVMFKALYSEKAQEFVISEGMEIVYHIRYTYPESEVLETQVNLDTWKTQMEENENKEADLINTTYFSAVLNCQFFDPVRGLTPEEGVKRIIAKYPNGVPLGEDQYYHLETLHIEPHKVPYFNPYDGKTAFAPIPYPVFVPAPCKKKKPCRYEDLKNE